MQQRKRVFISDSFHTIKIAGFLQELYGPEVEIYCEPGNFSNSSNDQLGGLLAAVFEKPTMNQASDPSEKKDFDLFFLCGRLILERDVDPIALKKNHGKPGAKVVAMSVVQDYLNEIKNKQLGADLYFHKTRLNPVKEMTKEAKEELISFLQ